MKMCFSLGNMMLLACSFLFAPGVSSAAESNALQEGQNVSAPPFFSSAITEFDSETENDFRLRTELESAFDSLAPFANASGTATESILSDPRPLASKLISFATKGPESVHGWVRTGFETNGIIIRPKKTWMDKFSPAEVESGLARDRVARHILLKSIQARLTTKSEAVQMAFFQAAETIWISGRPFTDGTGKPEDRRAEDGIPSAEALLLWFAENESLSNGVRKAARRRLDSLSEPQSPLHRPEPAHEHQ